jgi:transcriptional regulator with XRE-family HTH domain
MDTLKVPRPQESLADYIKRIRTSDGMTQFELAQAAGIHSRSVGKIERGSTTRLNRKTLLGLAVALLRSCTYPYNPGFSQKQRN